MKELEIIDNSCKAIYMITTSPNCKSLTSTKNLMEKFGLVFNTYKLFFYDYLYLNSMYVQFQNLLMLKPFFSDLSSQSQSCDDVVAL
jgi:hypothetical protein